MKANIQGEQKNFGVLGQEYPYDGYTVRVFYPDLAESSRMKKDIQIREKIKSIVINNTVSGSSDT